MRLVDRIGLSKDQRYGGNGGAYADIPDALANQVRDAPLRFVLDRSASRACGELIRTAEGLFETDNALLRLPAESFWIEYFEEPEPGVVHDARFGRLGMFVECDASGRQGIVRHFKESADGRCVCLAARVEFDLDAPPALRPHSYRLDHADIAHIRPLLKHSLVVLEEGAIEGGVDARAIAEAVWFDVPVMLAFAALLNSPDVVETRASDLARLNRARIHRGRMPLLDHIEVRLDLGLRKAGVGGPANGAGFRMASRLHYVRGHFVQRAGKTFWRSSHLRGDTGRALVQKTVRVTASSSGAALPQRAVAR